LRSYFEPKVAKKGWELKYAEVKLPFSIMNDIYVLMYRFFPGTNKLSNILLEQDSIRKMVLELIDMDRSPTITRLIKKDLPDIVVSTYLFHTHALVRLRREMGLNFKIYTVVADPWTMNPVSFAPEAEKNIVYDEVGVKMGKKYDVPEKNILKTGWWVRPEMYDKKIQTSNFKLLKKRGWGIEDGRQVVFVGGGSLGTNAILKFLPVLLLVKTKVAVVFNTGTDKLAYNTVEQYCKLLKSLGKDKLVQIINLGWIDDMASVLSACDIVFGKAGPNFLFDVVAVGKPFVAITHIGGQEDGNIDLIKQKKLGWIREHGNSAASFFLRYLNSPKSFQDKYRTYIAKEARNNEKGLEKVWKSVEKEMM